MTFRRLGAAWALFTAALLAGCAGPVQQPLNLANDFFSSGKAKQGRTGVIMAELPRPDTQFPGAGCLLCLAVANGAHSSMNKEVQGFSTAELTPLPAQVVDLLKKQGVDAVLINEPLKVNDLPDFSASDMTNKSRKSFAAFKTKHQVDRLVVINFTALGVWRSYSAYVPTDVPKAVLYGTAQMVDLSTHSLDWHMPIALSRAAEGAWDEPKFPGLTNAYYQVLETGMDMVKKPFQK